MNTLIPFVVVVVVGITDERVGDDDDVGDDDGGDVMTKLPVLVLPIVLLLVSITCSV